MRFALSFAVASAGGAAILSVVTRWWVYGPNNGPIAVAVAAVGGVVVGAVFGRWLEAEDLEFELVGGTVLMLLFGLLGGALVAAPDDTFFATDGALAGFVFAISLMPLLLAAALLSRRARRSRKCSVLGDADRRGVWRVTACWLALTSVIGAASTMRALGDATFWCAPSDRHPLTNVSLSVALLGFVVAMMVGGFDLAALLVLHRSRRIALTPVRGRQPASDTLDLGIGSTAWLQPLGGLESYRQSVEERVALVGDFDKAVPLVRASFDQSMYTLAAASAATLFSLSRLLFE